MPNGGGLPHNYYYDDDGYSENQLKEKKQLIAHTNDEKNLQSRISDYSRRVEFYLELLTYTQAALAMLQKKSKTLTDEYGPEIEKKK